MQIINYLSATAIPVTIILIIIYGIKEKIKIFDVFLQGAKEGIGMVIKIFPTLIGLFVAIGALRSSGILDLIIHIISPIIKIFNIPLEIMPLAILRPISGSAAMAMATDMLKTYGTDTILGLIISTIMGSTETTIYTIAIYTGAVGIKKTRFVLVAALIGDVIGIITSVIIWQILS